MAHGAVVRSALAAVSLAALVAASTQAQATEGYFQPGYGAVQQGQAGAGVANTAEAMSLAINPAGIARAGTQYQSGMSIFLPSRGFTATGTVFVSPGSHDSNGDIFAIPNSAFSYALDANSAIGIASFGNGGMNTSYKVGTGAIGCGGGIGVFCGGKAGIDMMQAFITVGYARQIGGFSFGVAPIMAIQRFSARGFGAFANAVTSSDPVNMTNRGNDYSVGGGVRAGVQFDLTDAIRVGLSGQTPIWMQPFDKYRGLFADRGDFDVPANVTAGLTVKLSQAFSMSVDYKHIFYGAVGSVGNSSRAPLQFGAKNGPGFGWKDVDVVSLGLEYKATDALTLRAGYAYNTNPIRSRDVMLNIVAPGVVKHHLTAGLSYNVTRNLALDLAGIYVPENKVAGPEFTPAGATPGSRIEIRMHQFQVTAGLTYKFDTAPTPAPIVRKY